MELFDLIVIGGGPGGYEAAAIGSAQGLKVALIERDELGGTCLNRGCIPTKTFCRTAQIAQDTRDAASFGVNPGGLHVDMARVVERKNEVVGQLREGVRLAVGKTVVRKGVARMAGPHTVGVSDPEHPDFAEELYSAPKIIIATGSTSAILPIPGAEKAITSTEALDLDRVPAKMVIIGGGVIGLEFASIFSAFGAEVTVVEYLKEVLPVVDRDVAKRLRTALSKRGVSFVLGAEVKEIAEATHGEFPGMLSVRYEAKGKPGEATGEKVLMAVGRRPVIPADADTAGQIAVGRRGIEVDDNFMTNVEGVYAIGDCNGRCLLAHAASAQARCVMGEKVNMDVMPSAVFTIPECASVGLTEEQAKAASLDYKSCKAFFRANGKAVAMGEDEGLVKILVNKGDGKILGAHICGPHAADLIAEISLAMANGLTAADIVDTIHAHPSLPEVIPAALAH